MRRIDVVLFVLAALAEIGCSSPPIMTNADGAGTVISHSTEDALSLAARDALSNGRHGRPVRILWISVEKTDRYGGKHVEPALQLVWPDKELTQVHWDGISAYQLVDLAILRVESQAGEDVIRTWCWEESNHERHRLTPQLCNPDRLHDALQPWLIKKARIEDGT